MNRNCLRARLYCLFVKDRISCNQLKDFFKAGHDHGPVVPTSTVHRCYTDFRAQALLFKKADDPVREGHWFLSKDDIQPIGYVETFCTDRSRYNWLSHGHGFENLQSGAATDAQWNDAHGRGSEVFHD